MEDKDLIDSLKQYPKEERLLRFMRMEEEAGYKKYSRNDYKKVLSLSKKIRKRRIKNER